MMYHLFHFREAHKVFEQKAMASDVTMTVNHVLNSLNGAFRRNDLLRAALDEMGWYKGPVWNIIAGRRYRFLGYKHGVAIEAGLDTYDYIVEGLMTLQLGYDKGQIDAGILMLSTQGSRICRDTDMNDLIVKDMGAMEPILSMPVSICLYDLNDPFIRNGLQTPAIL